MYVLDKGMIILEETMGGDVAVIEAARICWQTKSDNMKDKDVALLTMLLEKAHMTPFEHAVLRWRVRCPIFVARQWFRHRMGTFNERSLRYTRADRVFYVPDDISSENTVPYLAACETAFDCYQKLVDGGMKKEQARCVLPLATYTEFIWTVNAHSFMNWLDQRLAPGAQYEHRLYASAALNLWEGVMPITATAFKKNVGVEEKK